jgi:hydroxypyruvate isomerase
MIDRREFLQLGSAAALSLATAGVASCSPPGRRRFLRDYAPQLGMFRHHAGLDPLGEIRFLAAEGFRSIEDTGLRAKPTALQRQIGAELARCGMTLACFTGVADFGRPTFASGRRELRDDVLRQLRSAVDAAERVGARQLSIVPGRREPAVSPKEAERHAIDLLVRCADICEPRGIMLLVEPVEHGSGSSRVFLRSARQAAAWCRAVRRPSCRVLVDLYQQAVAGEDLPRLLSDVGDVLGHVQLGDFPGRREPGTGELDFPKVFATLDAIGYRGALGMEHGVAGSGQAGERAVIDAYLALDRRAYRAIA